VRELLLTLALATSGAGLEREHDQVRLCLRLGRLGDRTRDRTRDLIRGNCYVLQDCYVMQVRPSEIFVKSGVYFHSPRKRSVPCFGALVR